MSNFPQYPYPYPWFPPGTWGGIPTSPPPGWPPTWPWPPTGTAPTNWPGGGTPPILPPIETRGLDVPLNPADFPVVGPVSSSQPGQPAQPAGSAFSADDLAVLAKVSQLIKQDSVLLSSADKTVANAAKQRISTLCVYTMGVLEAKGTMRMGTFVDSLAPRESPDFASASAQLTKSLDDLVANPGPTRIIPFLVGVIVGMAISAYITS